METVTTSPRTDADEGLTRADLDALPHGWPHDGRKVELVDGAIVMSAAPRNRHQEIAGNLHLLLRQACPPGLRVRFVPFDVELSERTVLQPDLLIARADDLVAEGLVTAPVLAVEVLSPSSRRHDLGTMKDVLQEAGCPSYWVVDQGGPDTPPSLVAWELTDGSYVEVARVSGAETWHAERPFPIRVTPDLLLDG